MPEILAPEEVEAYREAWRDEYPCVCPEDKDEKKLTCTSCRMFFITRKYGQRDGILLLLREAPAVVKSAL